MIGMLVLASAFVSPVKLIVCVLLVNLIPQALGDRQALACSDDKFCFLKRHYLIHIDDTVAVAAGELRIAKEHTGKVLKPHIGFDKSVCQMYLYVVIIIVCVQNIIDRKLYHNTAFFYLNIMAAFLLDDKAEVLHSFTKLLIGNGFQHVIQSSYLVSLQSKIFTAGSENNGALTVFLPNLFRNPDSRSFPL